MFSPLGPALGECKEELGKTMLAPEWYQRLAEGVMLSAHHSDSAVLEDGDAPIYWAWGSGSDMESGEVVLGIRHNSNGVSNHFPDPQIILPLLDQSVQWNSLSAMCSISHSRQNYGSVLLNVHMLLWT